MKVIYPGPSRELEILHTDLVAKQGEPIDVPDELGQALVEQGWTQPKPDKGGK